jgi:hypothetical protein
MRKIISLISILAFFISCKKEVTQNDLKKINGYWEIEFVKFPNGDKKDYKVNSTIDYFELKKDKGYRQKVMPQLDGTYKTNNLKENVYVKNEDDSYFLFYSTNYGKWQEEIIEVQDSILVLKNAKEVEYHYKKPIPFSLK